MARQSVLCAGRVSVGGDWFLPVEVLICGHFLHSHQHLGLLSRSKNTRNNNALNYQRLRMFFKLKRSNAMKFNSRFQVIRLRWWHKPVPLYDKDEKDSYRRIGWVWNQKAYLVDNMVEGWVAFVKDQTPEKIDVWWCSCCGMALDGITRERLEKSIKETK